MAVSSSIIFLFFFNLHLSMFFLWTQLVGAPVPPSLSLRLGRPTDNTDKELFSVDKAGKTLQGKYLPAVAPILAVSLPIRRLYSVFSSLYRRSVHLS